MVTIRKMKSQDIGRVIEIERQSFTLPWSENAYLNEISNRSAYYTVAEEDGVIVGYIGMWIIMDEAHITTLAVDPKNRKHKIGERLLIDLLSNAMRIGARRATLEVRSSNIKAQNLYSKYSFTSAAIRKAYYRDNDEDAIVMWIYDLFSDEFTISFNQLKDSIINENISN